MTSLLRNVTRLYRATLKLTRGGVRVVAVGPDIQR